MDRTVQDAEPGLMASIKRNPVVHVLLAFIFVASGIIVNILQVMTMILWWAGNKDLYRTVNIKLAYLHWALIPFLIEWWAGVKFNLYIKPEDYKKVANESAVVVLNHKYDIDWAIGWVVGDRVKILGNAKCMAKSALSYVPLIGWSWRFCEYIFVTRNLEKDTRTILKALKNLAEFKHPYWMLIFCEGTRFTEEKHKQSMEFAAKKGLKPLKHHLLPRTGGFRMVVKGVRDSASAVYDSTIYVKGNQSPTLLDLLCGKSCEVEFLVERVPINEVPEDDQGCSDYVRKMYEKKDEWFDYCTTHDKFPLGGGGEPAAKGLEGLSKVDCPRRTECLWIAISWTVLILTPLFYYIWSIVSAGSIVPITVMTLIMVAVSYLFKRIVAQGAVSSSSSTYGIDKKAS